MWFSSDSLIVYILQVNSPYSHGCVRSYIYVTFPMLRFNNGLLYFVHYSVQDKFLKGTRWLPSKITPNYNIELDTIKDFVSFFENVTFHVQWLWQHLIIFSKKIHYISKWTSPCHHDTMYLNATCVTAFSFLQPWSREHFKFENEQYLVYISTVYN